MFQFIQRNNLFQLLLGVALATITYLIVPSGIYSQAPAMAAVVVLMAVWWILEAIPIPVTSVLPIVLFPLLDIGTVAEVGVNYGKPIIFLFLGGFILALGLQESGIHRRIALKIVQLIGSSPNRLILGFMVATGMLSMWISNTASVMVMLPIGLSVMQKVKEEVKDSVLIRNFGICLMLCIAYAADIGGMATLIGTPPNLIFLEMYSQLVPDAVEVGFLDWMKFGLPLSLLFLATGWILLTRFIYKMPSIQMFGEGLGISNQLKELGKMTRDEKITGAVFLIAAVLWMTGSDFRISDDLTIRGWRTLLNLKEVSDSAVAIAMASVLFIVPSSSKGGKPLLTWEQASQIPWGILLLFGGGFAIAAGFKSSGLSELTASFFTQLPDMPELIVLAIVCVFVTFLTELATNSAVASLVLPILATGAVAFGIDPKFLMIPATLSASCAFMMPIASPTQAIVFGSKYVTIKQMMRAGIWFNLLGILLIMVVIFLIHSLGW